MSFAAQTSYIRVSEKTRPKIGTFFKSFFFFYDLNLSSYVQKVVGNKPFYKFRSAESETKYISRYGMKIKRKLPNVLKFS